MFVEWMMGLPEGWVTGHGLTQAEALKMLGNGVCPQQAALAIDLLTEGKGLHHG
jgi:DNA (cytosine-5)-methyltransferase 1